MSEQDSRIECPNCGQQIDVNDLLYHQLESEIKKDYNAKLAAQEKQFDARQKEIDSAQQALAKAQAEIDEQVANRVSENLKVAKAELNDGLRAEMYREMGVGDTDA